MNDKFYLITEDLGNLVRHFLLRDGSQETRDLPTDKILVAPRRLLQTEIKHLLQEHRVLVFKEAYFRARLNDQVDKNRSADRLVVAMDYYASKPDYILHITRVSIPDQNAPGKWVKINDPRHRPGELSVADQVRSISNIAKQNQKDIVLVDDGIWSSGTFEHIIKLFAENNVRVVKIVAGIVAKKDLTDSSILDRTDFLHSFESKNMADWICERDFFIGSPFFGRTLGTNGGSEPDPRGIGIPYCQPLGDCDWASIDPARAQAFSQLCIKASKSLFLEIEKHLGRQIMVGELRTMPLGAHRQPQMPFVDWLDQLAGQI
ncbi:MAG: phosphoribosyltransferase [Patescibacteria group bacterium]|jgi:hypothetical protein